MRQRRQNHLVTEKPTMCAAVPLPRRRGAALMITLVLLTIACAPRHVLDTARPRLPLSLPEDEAAHYGAQMEWWYYTGHLETAAGMRFGFEVTFFKRVTSRDRLPPKLPVIPAHWVKDTGMLAHFCVTDYGAGIFRTEQIHNLTRSWRADPRTYDVAISDWSARAEGAGHRVKARMRGYELDLLLVPKKPAALHGPGGIVDKGGGLANWYYSWTRLGATGTVTVKGKPLPVTGQAWMDHEFGPMELMKTGIAWDWFSIQLADGRDLMIYLIRDGEKLQPQSGGTFVHVDGATRWLKLDELQITPLASWTSHRTGGVYPAKWTIVVKPLKLRLTVSPLMADQEVRLSPVTYWEGAVDVTGTEGASPVAGRGYVELVGYDKKSSFGKGKRPHRQ